MSKLILVSNRLPISVRLKNGKVRLDRSAGGLALGLDSYLSELRDLDHLWIGWPGTEVGKSKMAEVNTKLKARKLSPVFLSQSQAEKFYSGFSNDTLWPLFHLLPAFAHYNKEYWDSYRQVNAEFARAVAKHYQKGDVIWVHDYHLMLLPKLLRESLGPEAKIGFFLHIPFPPFEIFRLLPDKWRRALLKGVLGADLAGFHTYDYGYYFNNAVQRILGYESNLQEITSEGQTTKIDAFPMGIDFKKFNASASEPAVKRLEKNLKKIVKGKKVILSIDRLDYTKGIIKRLEAYSQFLEKNPGWRGKVVLMMVLVPSREEVLAYQQMKSQIDELVGQINGRFGSVDWSPIIYQFKSLDFKQLAALYSISHVALVTPLRDGMNLVAKEYIASRQDSTGVLILSEMAGAAAELGEAILINPNHEEAVVEALEKALSMGLREQKTANALMRERLKRYDVNTWAGEFISALHHFKQQRHRHPSPLLSGIKRAEIIKAFKKAKNPLVLLDYDGTLVPYAGYPQMATPSPELLKTLNALALKTKGHTVIISGRGRGALSNFFKNLPLSLIGEHGVWLKEKQGPWKKTKALKNDWKKIVLPMLKTYADRLPGAFVEEKEYSLAWHYRLANPWQAQGKVNDLTNQLITMTANMDVLVAPGKKIVEIRPGGVDKGSAAQHFLAKKNYDFVLSAGDDSTDESMFKVVPKNAYSIKVGLGDSSAKFSLDSPKELLSLLKEMLEKEKGQ